MLFYFTDRSNKKKTNARKSLLLIADKMKTIELERSPDPQGTWIFIRRCRSLDYSSHGRLFCSLWRGGKHRIALSDRAMVHLGRFHDAGPLQFVEAFTWKKLRQWKMVKFLFSFLPEEQSQSRFFSLGLRYRYGNINTPLCITGSSYTKLTRSRLATGLLFLHIFFIHYLFSGFILSVRLVSQRFAPDRAVI